MYQLVVIESHIHVPAIALNEDLSCSTKVHRADHIHLLSRLYILQRIMSIRKSNRDNIPQWFSALVYCVLEVARSRQTNVAHTKSKL